VNYWYNTGNENKYVLSEYENNMEAVNLNKEQDLKRHIYTPVVTPAKVEVVCEVSVVSGLVSRQ